jgi:hypothetical protein
MPAVESERISGNRMLVVEGGEEAARLIESGFPAFLGKRDGGQRFERRLAPWATNGKRFLGRRARFQQPPQFHQRDREVVESRAAVGMCFPGAPICIGGSCAVAGGIGRVP